MLLLWIHVRDATERMTRSQTESILQSSLTYSANTLKYIWYCKGNYAIVSTAAHHGVRLATRSLPIGKNGPWGVLASVNTTGSCGILFTIEAFHYWSNYGLDKDIINAISAWISVKHIIWERKLYIKLYS